MIIQKIYNNKIAASSEAIDVYSANTNPATYLMVNNNTLSQCSRNADNTANAGCVYIYTTGVIAAPVIVTNNDMTNYTRGYCPITVFLISPGKSIIKNNYIHGYGAWTDIYVDPYGQVSQPLITNNIITDARQAIVAWRYFTGGGTTLNQFVNNTIYESQYQAAR